MENYSKSNYADKDGYAPLIKGEVIRDENNVMYYIYVLYGFASLSVFNCLLSTLDFFSRVMPGHNPSFVLSFVLSVLVIFSTFFVILYAHKLDFYFKNNCCILINIPILLSVPILSNYLETSDQRFTAFNILLMVLSVISAL